jgi:hypothetical protein
MHPESSWIQSTGPHLIILKSILILYFHLRLGVLSSQ